MVLRHNHYEVAFEEYVRSESVPYVAVDEKRRALLAGSSLKSMDFIVYGPAGKNLLIDVKGRQFPSGIRDETKAKARPKQQREKLQKEKQPGRNPSGHKWVNWATNDDVVSLLQWEQVFGENFSACLVFAYEILAPCWYGEVDQLFFCQGRVYAFYLVRVKDYYVEMKRGSQSWDTYFVPARQYRKMAVPVHELFVQKKPAGPNQKFTPSSGLVVVQ